LNYTGFIVAVSTYFQEKYAIAFSITQTGVGIGIFVFGPLFKFLIEVYGWRGSFLICGAFGFNFTLLGALIFPLRKAKVEAVQLNLLDEKSTTVPEAIPASIILRDARGWLLHLNSFFWLLATLIMYILLGDFAASKSLDDYYIYMFSAMGVGDLFGRLLTGPFIEYFRLDVIKMYSVVQSLCSLSIFTFLLVSDGIHLIVQGVIFSFLYGCQCVLLALVPRHIFGAENLSVIFGVNMFFGGAGILIGPPIAGLLVDITHSYTAAFIFSGLSELAGAFVCLVCLYLTRKTSVNLQNVT
jgi:predicted MFS family arabinose efflux permease